MDFKWRVLKRVLRRGSEKGVFEKAPRRQKHVFSRVRPLSCAPIIYRLQIKKTVVCPTFCARSEIGTEKPWQPETWQDFTHLLRRRFPYLITWRKTPLEKVQKNPMEKNSPEIAGFCPLSWSSVPWEKLIFGISMAMCQPLLDFQKYSNRCSVKLQSASINFSQVSVSFSHLDSATNAGVDWPPERWGIYRPHGNEHQNTSQRFSFAFAFPIQRRENPKSWLFEFLFGLLPEFLLHAPNIGIVLNVVSGPIYIYIYRVFP